MGGPGAARRGQRDAEEDAGTAEEDASVAAEEDARISCGRMRRTQDPCRGDGMESVIETLSIAHAIYGSLHYPKKTW